MKKVLLTSTALVLVAGVAAAEVSVSGGAVAGFKYDEDGNANGDETVLHYELDFGITGSGTTDAGLEFGASFDLDLDDETETNTISDPEIFISGTFGTITIGNVDVATDPMGFSDVGFDGIGIDDQAEVFKTIGEANVHYQYSVGDLTLALSGTVAEGDESETGDYAAYVSYGLGTVTLELGYAVDDEGAGSVIGDSADMVALGVSGDAGSLSYSVFYHMADGDDGDAAGYGASVSFAAGSGTTVTVAVGDTDVDGDDPDFGVGFEYDLGGGAAIAGGIGSTGLIDDRTVADLGMTFSF